MWCVQGNALGVGIVVETSDGFVVMMERSNTVAEGAGLIDIPGGHPEPQVCVPLVDRSGCHALIAVCRCVACGC